MDSNFKFMYVMLCFNISHIAFITAKNVDYRCIIHNISKSEAINILDNSVLENHGYLSKNIAYSRHFYFLFLCLV